MHAVLYQGLSVSCDGRAGCSGAAAAVAAPVQRRQRHEPPAVAGTALCHPGEPASLCARPAIHLNACCQGCCLDYCTTSTAQAVHRKRLLQDGPTMPIVAEGDEEPNDTFREQLIASAEAAVKVRMGSAL